MKCKGTTKDGRACGLSVSESSPYCRHHTDQDDGTRPETIQKLRVEATKKLSSVITREEGLEELSRIVRREVKETKTTSTGDTYEAGPSNDDVVKAYKEIARTSGWYDEHDEGDHGPRTVIMRPPGLDAG
jgi:hypothetical protein